MKGIIIFTFRFLKRTASIYKYLSSQRYIYLRIIYVFRTQMYLSNNFLMYVSKLNIKFFYMWIHVMWWINNYNITTTIFHSSSFAENCTRLFRNLFSFEPYFKRKISFFLFSGLFVCNFFFINIKHPALEMFREILQMKWYTWRIFQGTN